MHCEQNEESSYFMLDHLRNTVRHTTLRRALRLHRGRLPLLLVGALLLGLTSCKSYTFRGFGSLYYEYDGIIEARKRCARYQSPSPNVTHASMDMWAISWFSKYTNDCTQPSGTPTREKHLHVRVAQFRDGGLCSVYEGINPDETSNEYADTLSRCRLLVGSQYYSRVTFSYFDNVNGRWDRFAVRTTEVRALENGRSEVVGAPDGASRSTDEEPVAYDGPEFISIERDDASVAGWVHAPTLFALPVDEASGLAPRILPVWNEGPAAPVAYLAIGRGVVTWTTAQALVDDEGYRLVETPSP